MAIFKKFLIFFLKINLCLAGTTVFINLPGKQRPNNESFIVKMILPDPKMGDNSGLLVFRRADKAGQQGA
jgi:hypothetical protein